MDGINHIHTLNMSIFKNFTYCWSFFPKGFPKVLEKKLYLLRETLLGQDICKYPINLIAVPKPVHYIRTLSPSAP